ncbi:hypothetical protein KEM54_000553 [Ascosphaera aggregata]|nr:hypothetical protein KEM54_000553 [Ascosphaera aggregata]
MNMVSSRKPIYDDEVTTTISSSFPASFTHQLPPTSSQAEIEKSSSPIPPTEQNPQSPLYSSQQAHPTLASRLTGSHQAPTDRLAAEVRRARLFVSRHSLAAENSLNNFLSRALHHETRIANTIASLAPHPASGEKLLPGAVYVGVSGMAGSILSRNRGILLRSVTPLTFAGVAAAWCLPVTLGNVGDLVFEWEKQVPGLAENHVEVKERITSFVETGIAHSGMATRILEAQVGRGRKVIEEWLKKGN